VLRLLVFVLAFASLTASAAELEFEGTPSIKVEVVEGITQTAPVPPQRARNLAVRVIKTPTGYAWASRNDVPLLRSESGAYVNYVATTGAGYVRVLNPAMRKAIESLPKDQRDKEFLYMEHMVNQLGSITYFGR
jgi:hypothetical protein